LSVATRNCIGLSRRLRPTGYAALRSHSPEEVSTRVGRRAAARFLCCSGAGQLLLARHAERPWHQARRDPTGLSPDPAVTQEAVIQVFAAPAVAWRGLLSVHTWIAVKPAGAPRFTRYEVLGFGVTNGAPAAGRVRQATTSADWPS
jgi:hypothetical protein